jgi:hypothetical protein
MTIINALVSFFSKKEAKVDVSDSYEIYKNFTAFIQSGNEVHKSNTNFTDDEIHNAVLSVLQNEPFKHPWMKSIPDLQSSLKRLDEVYRWAESLSDRRLKKEYIGWLDFFKKRQLAEITKIKNYQRDAEVVDKIEKPPASG